MQEARQKTQWGREEIRILKKLFRSISNQALANLLERTPKAIERKAAKLGLFKTKKYLDNLNN